MTFSLHELQKGGEVLLPRGLVSMPSPSRKRVELFDSFLGETSRVALLSSVDLPLSLHPPAEWEAFFDEVLDIEVVRSLRSPRLVTSNDGNLKNVLDYPLRLDLVSSLAHNTIRAPRRLLE